MGWDSAYHWTSKKIVVNELLNSLKKWDQVLEIKGFKSTVQGFYAAIRTKDNPNGFIYCALIERHGKTYAMKTMSEHMGPTMNDCPLQLLAMIPDPKENYSTEWRKRVLEYHRQKNIAKARVIEMNARVTLYGKEYLYKGKLNRSHCVMDSNAKVWRLSKKQYGHLVIV